ncbi:hypothetical protein NEIG_02705, partial [Nematocida sp. ERTm5]
LNSCLGNRVSWNPSIAPKLLYFSRSPAIYLFSFQATRRFHKTSPIRTLFDFLAVKNFSTESIRVFNSDIPKKDISQLYDISKTFGDVNWPEREILFVEETEN